MSYTTKNDKVYNSWRKMHIRCYDSNYHSYHRYGGRGITVCERWHTYDNFKADLWDTWFEGATLDRLNNDWHYEPKNCEWKTASANRKPLKYDIQEMLSLYEGGYNQYEVAAQFGINQAHVSRLLKRARNERQKLS